MLVLIQWVRGAAVCMSKMLPANAEGPETMFKQQGFRLVFVKSGSSGDYTLSPLPPDKYSSQFGGGSQYAYFHEEDETSFQLVDTARTQKTAYQRNRMRFAQVNQEPASDQLRAITSQGCYLLLKMQTCEY